MKPELTLYSRRDCRLCDEMKDIIRGVTENLPVSLTEVDIDGAPELQDEFGEEVPVLFIDGRKAFKYKVTARELRRKLSGSRSVGKLLAGIIFKHR